MAFLMDLTQIIWKRADTYEIKNGFGVDNQKKQWESPVSAGLKTDLV